MSKLDEMKRQICYDLFEMDGIYRITDIPHLHCLSDIEQEEIVSLLYQYGYEITVKKFVHSYKKIDLGRISIKTESYRGGTNRDHVVLVKNYEGGIRSAIIEMILIVSSQLIKDGRKCFITLPIVKVRYFQEHPHRYWFGRNSILQLWSTEFATDGFVLLPSIVRKCAFVKDSQKFERFELANGKRSDFRASDEVMFLI